VGDPGEHFGLAREASSVLEPMPVEHLERDDAAAHAIAGSINRTHPAGAGVSLDFKTMGDDFPGLHANPAPRERAPLSLSLEEIARNRRAMRRARPTL
jgi:hypothetical protein